MKDIIEYLPFYLGCKIFVECNNQPDYETYLIPSYLVDASGVKPILRPLESMTEEEFNEFKTYSDTDFSRMIMIDAMCKDDSYTRLCHTAFAQKYLFSRYFDIFNLHADGLCLYRNEKGKLY